jgi:hypothetical protein
VSDRVVGARKPRLILYLIFLTKSKTMLYCCDKFKNDFLHFDFDNMLIEEDNNMLNSNEHYIDYKNEYIEQTKINHKKLDDLLKKFNILNNFYTKSDDRKYVYHFIDNNTKEKLNNEIKNIHLYQRKLYTNFLKHIEFLNIAKNTTVNETVKILDKSRMTRLVNK